VSDPLVSAIIPVFNGEEFLAEAVRSALDQTYTPLEVLVIDDGSTDAGREVAARFGGAVACICQPNRGTGAARNEGVRHARGSYLAFLDQDDLWLPDKIALQMAALAERPGLDGVFGMVRQFRGPRPDVLPPRPAAEDRAGYLPSALLIRRDSFLRAGPFGTDWTIGEWADWYARAVDAGLRMEPIERLVALRRLHPANKGKLTDRRVEYARLLKASLDRRRLARRAAGTSPTS
jgi:glycosyltransferase involved in cell wall biosynthesis